MLDKYKRYASIMVGTGRIFDIAEVKFGEEFGVDNEELLAKYKDEEVKVIEAERLLRKTEKQRKRKERQMQSMASSEFLDKLGSGIFSFALSLPFGLLGGILGGIGRRR